MAAPLTLFVVEDDPVYLEMVSDYIGERFRRMTIHRFTTGEEALAALDRKPAVLVLDYFLARGAEALNGLDVLIRVAEKRPSAKIIILSAQDNIDVSVSMMKYGAFDYIVKSETALHRLQNTLNHIVTLVDYDRRIRSTRLAMGAVGVLLGALITYLVLRG